MELEGKIDQGYHFRSLLIVVLILKLSKKVSTEINKSCTHLMFSYVIASNLQDVAAQF